METNSVSESDSAFRTHAIYLIYSEVPALQSKLNNTEVFRASGKLEEFPS